MKGEPGRRAGPRGLGARGSGGGARVLGVGAGVCADLLWSLLVLGSPLIVGARDQGQAGRLPREVRSLRPTLLAGPRLAQIAGPAEVGLAIAP